MHIHTILVRRGIMSNAADIDIDTKEIIWSTWEELLLAFAVKRHGLKDWDTVALELQNRHRDSSLPSTLFTAQICKDKYRNLKRRFTNNYHRGGGGGDGGGGAGVGCENNNELFQSDDDDVNDEGIGRGGGCGGRGGGGDSFPWLEELRKLRVAELKQEVHRHDVSIRSLQIKVKTMEEERENNLKDDRNDDVKQQPDLDDEEVKRERSENDKSNNGDKEMPPDQVAGKSISCSAGDNENMSFNESNSTGNRQAASFKTEPAEVKPDPQVKPPAVGEDSCNDSSDRHEVKKASEEKVKDDDDDNDNDGGGDSGDEFPDSVGQSEEGTKESSDVQSSASLLTTKRKRKRRGEDADGGGGAATASAPMKRESESDAAVKSEPSAVFSLLDKIRSHKHGSVFERRLESQKTEKYKNTIRRHVDLETIQARIDDGSYSSSSSSCSTKFYVDVLLIFNNAIVFFPKASPESLAAQELRQLVMKELKKNPSDPVQPQKLLQPKTDPERSDSLLAKHKSANPIIVCRKRSSISTKASSSSANKVGKDEQVTNSKPLLKSPLSTSNEDEDSVKLKTKEKPVTGARSMRRSSKGRTSTNNNNNKPESSTPNVSNNKSSSSQQHSMKDKGDKKKSESAAATTKRSSAADFLKRMKKNSPAKGTMVETLKNSKDNNTKGGKKDQPKKKLDDRKVKPPARRSGGVGRKLAKEESSPSKKTIGRPSKKGKEVVVTGGKRRRDGGGGESEGSSKRAKKRSR